MVQTKKRLSTDLASGMTAASGSMTTQNGARRWRLLRSPLGGHDSQIDAGVAPKVSRRTRTGYFVRHYFEMCAPMCIGFALGDLGYFWAAGLFDYSEPFRQLPELSVLVVTFNMTAPMAAWMFFRGMPRRATVEMAAAMPILAIGLLAFGWLAIVPKGDLALLEHGLMMPVMLIPMFFRLALYTGRAGHMTHRSHAVRRYAFGRRGRADIGGRGRAAPTGTEGRRERPSVRAH